MRRPPRPQSMDHFIGEGVHGVQVESAGQIPKGGGHRELVAASSRAGWSFPHRSIAEFSEFFFLPPTLFLAKVGRMERQRKC